ncbi:MAG: 2-oxoacid:acceptor oxidoreductase subunit alpha [Planctomycetes bacterium]|nr:2-oxoacid:acceptor oxidoreductase subunit alpha [Planctomycetota bacterium]
MSKSVVNDFTLNIATPNGTGSQTSNTIIFRALYHMGIAAAAKNLFPSNIQGLPTWFSIRVSAGGWQARAEQCEILLTLNPATWNQDIANHPRGGVIVDNTDYKIPESRFEGYVRYSVPFESLALKHLRDAKLRPKLKNLIYVGVVAQLFGIEEESVQATIRAMFANKQELFDVNWEACKIGIDYAKENLKKQDPYRFARANQTAGKILIDGNDACGLGAVYGGCTAFTWYPITPASSLGEAVIEFFRKYRTEKDGTRNYAVVQAEDELAAIGMVLGAGWAGARAATSTSGPGISLMGENFGYGYYAEIPAVVFDVQRVGPSTGLPTRTQQSDLLLVAFHSHGDTSFPMLIPANAAECFEFAWRAFDVADRYQTPVVVMSDLDLGMNTWVSEPLVYPDRPFDRGKILTPEKLAQLEKWGRYKDVDGDGIPYRSIAGRTQDSRFSYFTRGSGHDENAVYSESDQVYARNLDRLARKIRGTVQVLPEPVLAGKGNAEVGIIAFGSTDHAVREALAANETAADYLRLRAYPFHDSVGEFIAGHDRVVVIEQNQQGQMAQLLRMALPEHAPKIESITYYGGLPLSAAFVARALNGTLAKV